MEILKSNSSAEAIRTTQLGILISIILIFVKGISGHLGHSYALIADATESGADVLSSGLLWGALKYAQRPPDKGHPYGHGKAEPVASILIGFFLLGAAAWITYHAIGLISTPHELPKTYTLYILLLVIIIKEGLFRYVYNVGKNINSQAVIADAYHHRSDAITSVAALIGISVALLMGKGHENSDDWAALFACLFIIYNAYQIIRPAIEEIMDKAPTDDLIVAIRESAEQHVKVKRVEKCHVRKMGMDYYVDMHIEVDGNMNVYNAHETAHQVKDLLLHSGLHVKDALIHVEPYLDDPKTNKLEEIL